jgi:PTS system galactitol-specific IIA component
MMSKPVISENLIVRLDTNHITAEDVVTLLCRRLEENGYTDSSYRQAVLERESRFPTGLPTLPYPTAIPHADAVGVKETGVAVAVLSEPVAFRAMEAPERSLDVRLVLLLAVAHSSKQVSVLQWVCGILSDAAIVERLAAAPNAETVVAVFNELVPRAEQAGANATLAP